LKIDWKQKREQLLSAGACVIEGVLDEVMLEGMRAIATSKLAELSDAHRQEQKSTGSMVANRDLPELAPLIVCPAVLEALAHLGYKDIKFSRAYLISKPPHSPQLFWHQDFTVWSGEPRAYTDLTPQLFAMFYLVDTTPENGCLRLIPGSHRRRHVLHEAVGVAHTAGTRRMEDPDSPLYAAAADEVDVLAQAGDMVLGDGRALHAAHANNTDCERPVITVWYHPMFSELQEGTQAQITQLAQAEIEHWSAAERQLIAPIVANYSGGVEPTARDRMPGSQFQ
jgi:hypothetical protein